MIPRADVYYAYNNAMECRGVPDFRGLSPWPTTQDQATF